MLYRQKFIRVFSPKSIDPDEAPGRKNSGIKPAIILRQIDNARYKIGYSEAALVRLNWQNERGIGNSKLRYEAVYEVWTRNGLSHSRAVRTPLVSRRLVRTYSWNLVQHSSRFSGLRFVATDASRTNRKLPGALVVLYCVGVVVNVLLGDNYEFEKKKKMKKKVWTQFASW